MGQRRGKVDGWIPIREHGDLRMVCDLCAFDTNERASQSRECPIIAQKIGTFYDQVAHSDNTRDSIDHATSIIIDVKMSVL